MRAYDFDRCAICHFYGGYRLEHVEALSEEDFELLRRGMMEMVGGSTPGTSTSANRGRGDGEFKFRNFDELMAQAQR